MPSQYGLWSKSVLQGWSMRWIFFQHDTWIYPHLFCKCSVRNNQYSNGSLWTTCPCQTTQDCRLLDQCCKDEKCGKNPCFLLSTLCFFFVQFPKLQELSVHLYLDVKPRTIVTRISAARIRNAVESFDFDFPLIFLWMVSAETSRRWSLSSRDLRRWRRL